MSIGCNFRGQQLWNGICRFLACGTGNSRFVVASARAPRVHHPIRCCFHGNLPGSISALTAGPHKVFSTQEAFLLQCWVIVIVYNASYLPVTFISRSPVPSFSPFHIPSLLTKEGSPSGKCTKMLELLMCFFDDSALILPPYLYFIFLGSKITADDDSSHEIKRSLLLGRKAMTNLDSIFKKQRHYFANKGLFNQTYGFSSSHVWIDVRVGP